MKSLARFSRLSLGVVLCLLASSFSFANPSPLPMLEQSAEQMIQYLKNNKGQLRQHPQKISQAVEQYLLPQVDLEGMSRSVLGRQTWVSSTAAEKQAFRKAFTQLVIRTYATPLANYSDEQIHFFPLRGSSDKRFLQVKSEIIRHQGKSIPLQYSVIFLGGQWKIYDFSVEGISLIQSFRSQFAQSLQHARLNEVVQDMQARLNKGN